MMPSGDQGIRIEGKSRQQSRDLSLGETPANDVRRLGHVQTVQKRPRELSMPLTVFFQAFLHFQGRSVSAPGLLKLFSGLLAPFKA